MHPRFLDILCCPKTKSDLHLTAYEVDNSGSVTSGVLTATTGDQYPIVRGIPRFVEKEIYAKSFGYEWRKWSRVQFEAENASRPMSGHTQRMFEAITGFAKGNLENKLVVEFGCGPGRFLDIVRRNDGIAVGIDMSLAVESARENFRGDLDVLIVQGDILNPPFKKYTFDVGYTIGVLHHTPDPARGLKKLVEVLKKDGLVACSVYSKGEFYDFPSVAAYRKVHHATKALVGNRLALGYAYFSAHVLYHGFSLLQKIPKVRRLIPYFEKYIFVNVPLPDARWRVLDVFDAVTPNYASAHTPEELRLWFDEANCYSISQRHWGTTSFVGVKGGN